MALQSAIERFEASDLYVVITESFCGGRSALEVLDATLEAGVTLVQLREKDIDSRVFYELAQAFRQRTLEADALLVINDRLDIAMAVGADGVHLGQDDLPIPDAKRIAPDIFVGASTHNLEEAKQAQEEGADVINIGPIFTTQTKTVGYNALGSEALEAITPHVKVPFSCMGGIKPENVDELLTRGARHPAVVTAVTAAPNVKEAAEALREKIRAYT